jgi:flavorubredoxin
MAARKIVKKVYAVGASHWDRELFDELIPLPDGTSYNAYFIQGTEKNALIDAVDPTKEQDLLTNLNSLGITRLDYLIANHAEQDHSGGIPAVLAKYPMAKVVTNSKCKDMLISLLHIPEDKFIIVNDHTTLSLGDRTLEFIITPWVHWPETMVTYLQEEKILFSCDWFGAHLATNELIVTDESQIYEPAKRYYAEIMMPFRSNIKKNLQKIKDYDIEMIAPSHGQIYPRPSFIIDAYKDWISDNVKNEVVFPYVSMHGSVERMVYYLLEELTEQGIPVRMFNLTKTDIGKLAIALVDAATIVIASPTMLVGPHPAALYSSYLIRILRPKAKFIGIIGSFGWGGKMPEMITDMVKSLNAEILPPVIAKGLPIDSDYVALKTLAETIATKHKELNILGGKK